jgi:hypothetical protein
MGSSRTLSSLFASCPTLCWKSCCSSRLKLNPSGSD